MKKSLVILLVGFTSLLLAMPGSAVTEGIPSITILSPKGGESFFSGQDITASWNASGLDPSRQYRAEITAAVQKSEQGDASDSFYLATLCDLSSTFPCRQAFVTNGINNATVSIPATIYRASGNYNLAIRVIDWTLFLSSMGEGRVTVASDISGLISISQARTMITVLSPNGGETWQFGKTQTIRWASSGIKGGKVGVYLMNADNVTCSIGAADALAGTYTVTLQENQLCPGNPYLPSLKVGQYKVMIDAGPATGLENSGGTSANYFTITAPLSLKNLTLLGGNAYFQVYGIAPNQSYRIESSQNLENPWQTRFIFSERGEGSIVCFPVVSSSADFFRLVQE